jgi:hypothetical protein
MTVLFAALHMSLNGTSQTCRRCSLMTAIGGRPDNIRSMRVFRILTRTRHQPGRNPAEQYAVAVPEVCYSCPSTGGTGQ